MEFGRLGLDFAWVPFGELGNSYRYSMHLKFGDVDAGQSKDKSKDNVIQKNADDLESLLNLPAQSPEDRAKL